MPYYILSGQTARGLKETQLLKAESAKAAIAEFTQSGHGDVVLHTDETMAAILDPRSIKNGVTPQMWVEFGKTPSNFRTRFRQYMHLVFPGWGWAVLTTVVMYGLMIAGLFPGMKSFGHLGMEVRIAMLLIPLIIVALAASVGLMPARQYLRLVDASAWGRSEEVLAMLPRVRWLVGNRGSVRDDLTMREAKALADLGRMDEALEIAESTREKMPPWMFWGRLSGVFCAAGRKDEWLAAMKRSVELAPDNATCHLDLALTLIRQGRDPQLARAAFQQAMQLPVGDILQSLVTMADGMITLEEGDAQKAVGLLSQALRDMNPIATANPAAAQLLDRTKAYLALALNVTGDHDRALDYFRQAEPRLEAVRTLHDLRDRCLKELRVAPSVA